jgi:hypothetical protein
VFLLELNALLGPVSPVRSSEEMTPIALSFSRMILFSVSEIMLCLSSPLSAAVFERDWKTPGDGLLTYDDVNQREWLELTQTQLFQFPGESLEERHQAVLAELGPTGQFVGFLASTRDDVFSLALSAGIDTTTTDFSRNGEPALRLVQLLGGATSSLGGLATDNDASVPLLVFSIPNSRDFDRVAGLAEFPAANAQFGVWLYRAIPEPATLLLTMLGITGLFSVVWRFR